MHKRNALQLALSLLLIPLLSVLLLAFTRAASPSLEVGASVPFSAPYFDWAQYKDVAPEVWAKIEPLVLRQLMEASDVTPEAYRMTEGEPTKDGKRTYIVYLKEQADLEPAQLMATRLARRQAVVSALQATAQRTQADILAYLERQRSAGKVTGYTSYWIFNGLAVSGDLETLLALAARPEVEIIRANHKHRLVNWETGKSGNWETGKSGNWETGKSVNRETGLPIYRSTNLPIYQSTKSQVVEWNIAQVRADEVWRDFDVTGRGVVVANLDTGVDWTHPALRDQYRGANGNHGYNWFDFTDTYPNAPADGDGHGTHTMGTILGFDPDSDFYIGMAPDAQWITVKVFDDDGVGYDAWIHAGFQWLLAPTDLSGHNLDPSKAPDVVNNSWGPFPPNVADLTFLPDVQALRAAGIFPVFSAGNEGELGDGTVGAPAGFPESLAVGATDFDDTVASFSSRGPSFWGEFKPEVCAPGVDIRSSIPGGGYEGGWSGTSMAAPHVAGLAALLLSANRTLTLDELETFMRFTADDFGEVGPDNACGWGRIDAYDAVRWVLGAGKLYGLVNRETGKSVNWETGLPIYRSTDLPIYQSTTVPDAVVSGVSRAGDQFTAITNEAGIYEVSVPAGFYDVTASAFGYYSQTVKGVEVITGFMSVRDLALQPAPTGTLMGRVVEVDTGQALTATISAVDTPASASTDANGYYVLTLPVGTYTVRAASHAHKAQTVTEITIAPGEHQTLDFALETAPSILLVDADVWAGDSVATYYQWALDYEGYLYDTRPITDTEYLPTATELAPYDVVLWASPWASPGYINTDEELITYLDNGGRLLISGQDVGYWDSQWVWGRAPLFYHNYLYADYVRNKTGINSLKGLDGDILEGVGLLLEDTYAYKKGDYLASDEVEPVDGYATSIIHYESDGSAGLKTDVCAPNPYKTVYLSFGYEGAGPRPGYADVLDRAIQWLTAPRPLRGSSLRPRSQYKVGQPGTTREYSIRLVNNGQTAGAFDLAISDSTWPTAILDSLTMNPITRTQMISPCGWQDLVVRIDIPSSAAVGEVAMATVQATMTDAPSVVSTATLTTRAFPAWTPKSWMLTSRYRLAAATVGCELYAIGGWDWTGASTLNEMYDPVANYWTPKAPKPTGAANVGAAVLNDRIYVVGGLSNSLLPLPAVEVYDPATDSWWTTAPLPVGLSGVAVAAAGGKLYVFGGDSASGEVDTTYEYDPAADTWTRKAPLPGGPRSYAAATPLFPPNRGDERGVNGKIYVAGGWPDLRIFEEYDPANDTWAAKAPLLTGRHSLGLVAIEGYIYAVGGGSAWGALGNVERYDPATDTWAPVSSLNKGRIGMGVAVAAGGIYGAGGLDIYGESVSTNEGLTLANSLCPSIKKVDKVTASPGEVLTYTIALRNPSGLSTSGRSLGDTDFAGVTLADPIPAHTAYVPDSVGGGAIYRAEAEQIEWSGTLAAGTSITFTFQVTLDSPLLGGTTIANVAAVNDGQGTSFTKKAATRVQAANLETSIKEVDKTQASAGEVLTYTITLSNTGSADAVGASVVDSLLTNTTYVPGSASGGAVYDPVRNRIEWTGVVSPTVGEKTAYSWVDSDTPGGPVYRWEEISETGSEITSWTNRNNGFAGPFRVGFDFPFFGKVYSDTLYVGTSGYVSFGHGYMAIPKGTLPNKSLPNNDVIPFGGPLYIMEGVSHVYYQLLGPEPGEGSTRFVVEFVNIQWCCDLNTSHTFEIVLYPGGEILTQYRSLHGDSPWVVGIENEDGSQGLNYPPSLLHDGLAIEYLPPAPPSPPHAISFRARINDSVPPQTVIANTAVINDGAGFTYTRTVTTTAHIVDLSASTKTVGEALAVPGDVLTYTIVLRNNGEAIGAGFVDPVPAQTTYVPGSVTGGATYDAELHRIQWSGVMPARSERAFIFAVTTDPSLPDDTLIVNVATIADFSISDFGFRISDSAFRIPQSAIERTATTILKRPDLSLSEKLVSAARAAVGDVITYTVRVKNTGQGLARAVLTDSIPIGSVYVPDSAWAGSGRVVYEEANSFANTQDRGRILWNGEVPPRGMSTVLFAVTVTEERVIYNTATINDGLGGLSERSATTKVQPYEVYLPLVVKNYGP